MLDNEEYISKLVIYINKFRERVVQRCTGLEPGDLRTVIEEIRQELYKKNKVLTILIEDITALILLLVLQMVIIVITSVLIQKAE